LKKIKQNFVEIRPVRKLRKNYVGNNGNQSKSEIRLKERINLLCLYAKSGFDRTHLQQLDPLNTGNTLENNLLSGILHIGNSRRNSSRAAVVLPWQKP
jgi:hypothetical protein